LENSFWKITFRETNITYVKEIIPDEQGTQWIITLLFFFALFWLTFSGVTLLLFIMVQIHFTSFYLVWIASILDGQNLKPKPWKIRKIRIEHLVAPEYRDTHFLHRREHLIRNVQAPRGVMTSKIFYSRYQIDMNN
jgi:hypothetical protein